MPTVLDVRRIGNTRRQGIVGRDLLPTRSCREINWGSSRAGSERAVTHDIPEHNNSKEGAFGAPPAHQRAIDGLEGSSWLQIEAVDGTVLHAQCLTIDVSGGAYLV
jgi:hypothetical protein